MMNILVTGASGLLGLNLALETSREHVVYGVANSHSLKTEAFTVVNADLLAPGAVESLLNQIQPDWVIHCAALANVDACEADPALARKLNTELPGLLAQHVARGGARQKAARLVHISTDCVFDGSRGDYTEQDAPNPLGVYAQTKLEGEYAVLQADPQAIVARVNLFGWSMTGKRSLAEFFFNNLSAGKPMMGFNDVFFCPLLANDMAGVLVQMLEKRLSGVYHVVSSQHTSKYAFGVAIAQRFGLDAGLISPTSVAQAGLKAARSPNLTLRTEKLASALGQPLPSFSTGIEQFYTLYQQGYPQQLREMAG